MKLEELNALKEKFEGTIGVRGADATETRVLVGLATCGIAAGARPILAALQEGVKEKGLDNIVVKQTGCIGLCMYEPIVEVFRPGEGKVTYVEMNEEKAKRVLEEHLINGEPVTDFMLKKEG